jgi:hypothetical protein
MKEWGWRREGIFRTGIRLAGRERESTFTPLPIYPSLHSS